MANIFKIKKYWVLTICMVFCSLTSVIGQEQELSDNQIGFNVSRITASLKLKGISDQNIQIEIAKQRAIYKTQFLTMQKGKEAVLQEITPKKSARMMATRMATAENSDPVPASERAALIALYNSTNGDSWYNSGWDINNPDSDVSTWQGVIVSEGHVAGLSLGYNGLTGSIPNLSGLPYLQILDLSANGFTSTIIDQSLSSLVNLKFLDLSYCAFTGPIPDLSPLSELTGLSLLGNNFAGYQIPAWLNNLQSLNTLYLNDCYFSGTIPNLGNLTNLNHLSLSNNVFDSPTVPSWLNNLTSLQSLNLSNSNFTGQIPDLSALQSLTNLSLSNSNFTGVSIPSTFNSLTNLNTLDLSLSHFTGNIPDLSSLTQLNTLLLSFNDFSNAPIPAWMNNLTALNKLELSNCNFNGPITDLSGLTNLSTLNLSSNNFTSGNIPSWIFNFASLSELSLSTCNLTGSIPAEIGQLTSLQNLYLYDNELEGAIPSTINSITNLQAFYILENRYRFVDLLPQFENLSRISTFLYQPQAKTDTEKNMFASTGDSVTLTMIEDDKYVIGENGDKFQWFKDDISIPGATSKNYTIPYATTANTGTYYCLSNNENINDLTLQRNDIKLEVSKCTNDAGQINQETEQLCALQKSNFSFETSVPNLSYIWSVADSNGTILDRSPSNTTGLYSFNFPTPGDYTLTLITANGATKCSTMIPRILTVISCSDPAEEICMQNIMNVKFETNETNLTYKWTLKDTADNTVNEVTNTTGEFSFEFVSAGTYRLNMVATSQDGCITNFYKNLNVTDCTPCNYCASFNLVKNEKYLVSGWVKEVDDNTPFLQVKNYSKTSIAISFTDTSGSEIGAPNSFHTSGEIIDGWQRIVGEFVVPNNVDDMKLDLVNEYTSDGKTVYFDDIRILPTKGNMKSFVYDQKTQRLMAELDENNYATFYEYDLEGGLIRVKKETEKGVFTIQETRSGNTKND
ncbi:leucine-rich repeat domain-containing protein [Flavobacterium sp. KACC 22763]|uniref:leucine-rich repeat domain-containing protein n=1 Tax=Flavobacterium sp. KACC 22763 TaxID=3025668 RepID=UPI00236695B8|nr:hypothetical protein [Flavobacterium sp. KACC 22763]WDF64544.1 hypothetical protein PQ463_00020 [Flavobacterium sp. KACC 22763]